MTNKKEITEEAIDASMSFNAPLPMDTAPMMMQTQQDRFVEMALQSGDMEKLEKMLDLKERFDKEEARKSFTSAMAKFKSEGVEIKKDRVVTFENNDKSVTSYTHASLGNVVNMAVPALALHGLSHRWVVDQEINAPIKVTCVITHEGGHSESVTMQGAADTSGKKNSIQQVASTVHYLQRYTFLSATGLAVEEMDNDGQTADVPLVELITESQIADLSSLIDECNITEAEFIKVAKHESLNQIPADRFNAAVGMLERKRDAAK